jgi:hypothetical protein
MHWRSQIVAATSLMILAACARQPARPVEDLGGGRDVSQFTLPSLKGTRNGDRLDVQAVYSDRKHRRSGDHPSLFHCFPTRAEDPVVEIHRGVAVRNDELHPFAGVERSGPGSKRGLRMNIRTRL